MRDIKDFGLLMLSIISTVNHGMTNFFIFLFAGVLKSTKMHNKAFNWHLKASNCKYANRHFKCASRSQRTNKYVRHFNFLLSRIAIMLVLPTFVLLMSLFCKTQKKTISALEMHEANREMRAYIDHARELVAFSVNAWSSVRQMVAKGKQ